MISIVSCASQISKDIDNEVEKMESPENISILMENHKNYIENSKYLNQIQKHKLISLQEKTYLKSVSIKNKIQKLKLLLLKDLMSEDYSELRINTMARKIKNLNSDRMNLMLNSLKEAKIILGKNIEQKDFKHLRYFHDAF